MFVSQQKVEILIYQDARGNEPFEKWLWSLKDPINKARIEYRIRRIEIDGHLGDAKALGDGLHELKFHFGPGYRVYFGMIQQCYVILLSGGDKKSQSKDIKMAKLFWKDYMERQHGTTEEI